MTSRSSPSTRPEYAGLVQYYLLAQDVFRLGRLQWVMETSMLKTLAGKHRTRSTRWPESTRPRSSHRPGRAGCFQVTVERDRGRKPLAARFGGIPLKRVRTAVLTDQRPVMSSSRRNELIHRLLAGRCEICESATGLEVHHIRKLADLNKPGRRDKPAWMHLMAMRRRKTLVICRRCHEDIHAGRATKPTRHDHWRAGCGESSHAPFGKRPTEKDPATGTSPAVDFTLREPGGEIPPGYSPCPNGIG